VERVCARADLGRERAARPPCEEGAALFVPDGAARAAAAADQRRVDLERLARGAELQHEQPAAARHEAVQVEPRIVLLLLLLRLLRRQLLGN